MRRFAPLRHHTLLMTLETADRSQTRPVFSLIKYREIPLCCCYTKTRWDQFQSTVIARATHTLAATLALFRSNRPGRCFLSLNTEKFRYVVVIRRLDGTSFNLQL